MKYLHALVSFAAIATARPAPQSDSSQNSTLASSDSTSAQNLSLITAVCDGNTAEDRTVWCDHSINTDWYNEVPNTGVTREVCV